MSKNKEKQKIINKKNYENNKEKLIEKSRKYRIDNPEYSKQYRIDNHDKIIEKSRKYNNEHKEEHYAYGIKHRDEIKEKVFNHYGHKCMWMEGCEIIDSDMLQIDHINGEGNIHRRETELIGISFYRWLINNNFPEGFRLLCANHNWKHKANRE